MNVVALDLSLTATGVAEHAVRDRLIERVSVLRPPAGVVGVRRLDWIHRQVTALTQGAHLVVLEGYAFARPNQAHQIGELGGVVRLGLHCRNVRYVEVAPPALKKFATGTGNAKKEKVLVEAVKRLGYDGSDNNESDALWLLAMARVHYGLEGAPAVPAKNLEALQKVKWPELPGRVAA